MKQDVEYHISVSDDMGIARHQSQLRRVVELYNMLVNNACTETHTITLNIKYYTATNQCQSILSISMYSWDRFSDNLEYIIGYEHISNIYSIIEKLLSGVCLSSTVMLYLNNVYHTNASVRNGI